jgi:hypothetical protein
MNSPTAPSSVTGCRRPKIAGPWRRIITSPTRHLNDFCLFRDADGRWHAMGIVGTGSWASEQSLFHYVGDDFDRLFEALPDVLPQLPAAGVAPQKHAPFVVLHEDRYHLFYRRPRGTIMHCVSANPYEWPDLGRVAFEQDDARDVHVLRLGDEYHMYYCQSAIVDGPRAATVLRRSRDLEHWSEPVVVHHDMMRPAKHGYLESPVVIQRPEGFYLFIRHRLFEEDQKTVVLFSERPDSFPSGERQWFAEFSHVHAPEIVEHNGRMYLARVSGAPGHVGGAPPEGGWVDIAPLTFD